MDLPNDGSYIFSGAGIHGPSLLWNLVAALSADGTSGGDIPALHQSGLAAVASAVAGVIFCKDGR